MLYFPARAVDAAETRDAVGLIPPTVLVIDDEAAVLATLETILEGYGFQVVTARNGEQGLMAFRNALPDVVVTDIVMPKKDGIEAIRDMRRERPAANIIAMSGGGRIGTTDFATLATKLGADIGLQKPFESDELLDAIVTLLAVRCRPALATAAA